MQKSILVFKQIFISVAVTCVLFSHIAQAKSVGVFGLFESKSEQTQSKLIQDLEPITKHLGCILRREGKIIAAQGNYDVPDVNSFFLMECEASFIQNSQNKTLIDGFKHSVENLALLEGPISQFGNLALAKPGRSNSYIFKLSDYNNVSPKQRNLDLMKLDGLVKMRDDRYKTEAFIRVADAHGMKRPDELVVIYYESVESGERFRGNNADIMKLIGKFNKDHLIHASYLIAQSNL